MRFRLAVEDIEPQHWVAWALDLPVCRSASGYGQGGELWSARKVILRALWHERDHMQHIERLLLEE